MDVPPELPRALAFLVGYFGYETIGLVEKLPRAPQSDLALPDMLFVRPTVLLIFDRLKDELFLIAPVWAEGDGDPARRIAAAEERLDAAERALQAALPAPVRDARCRSRTRSIPHARAGAGPLWRDGARRRRTISRRATSFRWCSPSASPRRSRCRRSSSTARCAG